MTLQEVSEILGVTRERIRQIELKALMKLKKRPQVTALGRDLEVLPPPPPPIPVRRPPAVSEVSQGGLRRARVMQDHLESGSRRTKMA
jgi:hypothetical protein